MVRTLTFLEEFSVTAQVRIADSNLSPNSTASDPSHFSRSLCYLPPPGIPPHILQAVFSVGWVNDTFLQSFHSTINGDSNPIIDPWKSGKRSINFKTPVKCNAPSLIKKAIGWDVIPVVEHQSVTQSPDGSIVIECIPTPDIPGGGRFSTQVTFQLADKSSSGCQLKANLACSATGLGLLSGSIESFLVEAASGGMKEFISFLKAYIEELDSQGTLVGVLQPMGAFPPDSPAAPDAAAFPEHSTALIRPMSAEDEYFDASTIDRKNGSGAEEEEEEEEDESIAGLVSRELQTIIVVPGGTPVDSSAGIRSRLQFEESVLHSLRTMSGKSESTAAALKNIATRLDALENAMMMKTRGDGYRLLLTVCVAGLTGVGIGFYISNNIKPVGKI